MFFGNLFHHHHQNYYFQYHNGNFNYHNHHWYFIPSYTQNFVFDVGNRDDKVSRVWEDVFPKESNKVNLGL